MKRVEFESRRKKEEVKFNWKNFFYLSLFVWIFSIGGFFISLFQKIFFEKDISKEIKVEIVKREDWGADESLLFWTKESKVNDRTALVYQKYPEDLKIEKRVLKIDGKNLKVAKEYAVDVKRIVIHHTGTNQDFSKSENVEKYLQDLLKYHTNPNSGEEFTGDIPYHYLIAPDGKIYEGIRGGDKVIGSHVYGANTGSLGISVIGNFNTEEITDDAYKSLKNLIEKKAIEYHIDPRKSQIFLGNEIENLAGHIDYEDFLIDGKKQITDCPGKNLIPKIDKLRKETSGFFDEEEKKSNKMLMFAFLFVVSFGLMLYSREIAIREKSLTKR